MSTVASMTGIPEDKQVLLISNGDALDPAERVCSYSSAGTVSNALFNIISEKCVVTSQNTKYTPVCIRWHYPEVTQTYTRYSFDLTKCQESREIGSLYCGFVISRFCL